LRERKIKEMYPYVAEIIDSSRVEELIKGAAILISETN
jgi:hypothetical protein